MCAAHLLIRFLGSNVFCGSYKIPLVSEKPFSDVCRSFLCAANRVGSVKRALALRRRCGERSCDWQPRVASSERKKCGFTEPTDIVDLTARRSERALDAESMPPNKKEIPAHSADMYVRNRPVHDKATHGTFVSSFSTRCCCKKSHRRFFFVFVCVDD